MRKLYIVISSWDEYDDYYKLNECVCSSLFFAENKKTELENKYREKTPFPFTWCTEEEFVALLRDDMSASSKDIDTYYDWSDYNEKLETFNLCFIDEIDYYE